MEMMIKDSMLLKYHANAIAAIKLNVYMRNMRQGKSSAGINKEVVRTSHAATRKGSGFIPPTI